MTPLTFGDFGFSLKRETKRFLFIYRFELDILCLAGEAHPASRVCVFFLNPTLMNVAMRELDADHPSAAH